MQLQRPLPLLAVIAVALLAAGGVGVYVVSRNRAPEPVPVNEPAANADASTPESRDRERFAAVNAIKIALAGYFGDNRAYPDDLALLAPKYLATVPNDPTTAAPYGYVRQDRTYTVTFMLEAGVGALAHGEHKMAPNGFDVEPAQTPEPPDGGMTSQVVPPPEGTPTEPQPTQPEPTPEPTFPSPVIPSAPATDTDGDGVPDGDETQMGSDPNKVDSDGDGLSDGDEVYGYKTSPTRVDSDDDGFSDREEVVGGYDPTTPGAKWPDADGDGLSDQYEQRLGTDAGKKDTDGDSLADGDEVRVYRTDPFQKDSDGDTHDDATELKNGFEPNGPGPLTDERKRQIDADTKTYGLH